LIRNHTIWLDTAGKPIDCHEGAIIRVGDTFYWYGRTYRGNVDGVFGEGGAKFRCGFVCYRSTDLVSWTNEGDILTYPDEPSWLTEGTWHRPRMIFNAKTGKYVLWFFRLCTNGRATAPDVIAVADHPVGPFSIVGKPKVEGLDPFGDLATFLDHDGQGYLGSGDRERNCWISRLADDFQSTIGPPVIVTAADSARQMEYEGICLARYKGKYLAAVSGVVGLNPSETTYAVADVPMGPWRVKGFISQKQTWNSQVGSFFYLKEMDCLFALCDQWLTGPTGQRVAAEQSSQLWLPIRFNPDTEKAEMIYTPQWDPFPRCGTAAVV
jgi:hypothetical protein